MKLYFRGVKRFKRTPDHKMPKRTTTGNVYGILVEVSSPTFFNRFGYSLKDGSKHFAIFIDNDDPYGFFYQFICKDFEVQ